METVSTGSARGTDRPCIPMPMSLEPVNNGQEKRADGGQSVDRAGMGVGRVPRLRDRDAGPGRARPAPPGAGGVAGRSRRLERRLDRPRTRPSTRSSTYSVPCYSSPRSTCCAAAPAHRRSSHGRCAGCGAGCRSPMSCTASGSSCAPIMASSAAACSPPRCCSPASWSSPPGRRPRSSPSCSRWPPPRPSATPAAPAAAAEFAAFTGARTIGRGEVSRLRSEDLRLLSGTDEADCVGQLLSFWLWTAHSLSGGQHEQRGPRLATAP